MTVLDRKELPDNPELSSLLEQDEAWNIIYDSHTRSTPEAMARKIHNSYNDRDCDTIAMAVLIRSMRCPPQLVQVAAKFDDELNRLMDKPVANDPLSGKFW